MRWLVAGYICQVLSHCRSTGLLPIDAFRLVIRSAPDIGQLLKGLLNSAANDQGLARRLASAPSRQRWSPTPAWDHAWTSMGIRVRSITVPGA